MVLASQALWVIERHLAEPLTLGTIAEACGVSRYHLAHAFGASAGTSVMQYLRGRRLALAASALARGEADILGLALETGYGSHEAFSRAFKAQFGATPDAVRCRASTAGLAIVQSITLSETPIMTLETPRFETGKAMLLAGLSTRQSPGDSQAIAASWGRFMAVHDDIPDKTPAAPIGVSTNMDEDGTFDYVCAAEVSKVSKWPHGIIEVRIPAQRYAVFTHRGHVASLSQTYAAIWNRWFPEQACKPLEAPCLEHHLPSFDPRTGEGGVEIWIPVEA